jgi:hypothetical protein
MSSLKDKTRRYAYLPVLFVFTNFSGFPNFFIRNVEEFIYCAFEKFTKMQNG